VARVCTFSSAGSADPNGDAFTRVWSWGDGTANTTSTTVTQAHTYAAAGTYTVTLTLTDWWGDANSTTLVVTVA
jgi:PKD repeat protein